MLNQTQMSPEEVQKLRGVVQAPGYSYLKELIEVYIRAYEGSTLPTTADQLIRFQVAGAIRFALRAVFAHIERSATLGAISEDGAQIMQAIESNMKKGEA